MRYHNKRQFQAVLKMNVLSEDDSRSEKAPMSATVSQPSAGWSDPRLNRRQLAASALGS